jgi:hypothetical protein
VCGGDECEVDSIDGVGWILADLGKV